MVDLLSGVIVLVYAQKRVSWRLSQNEPEAPATDT